MGIAFRDLVLGGGLVKESNKKTKKKFITIKAAARVLGVSLSQAYNLLSAEKDPMPHYKIGGSYKIDEDELREWIERQRK